MIALDRYNIYDRHFSSYRAGVDQGPKSASPENMYVHKKNFTTKLIKCNETRKKGSILKKESFEKKGNFPCAIVRHHHQPLEHIRIREWSRTGKLSSITKYI